MAKYATEVKKILSFMHLPWMDDEDKIEVEKQYLKAMGQTIESLSDSIEDGVKAGYSVEVQLTAVQDFLRR